MATLRNLFGPADDLNNPLWNARLNPAVCALFFVLAETVFRSGKAHNIVLPMGWVQLVSMSIAMFKAKDIVTAGRGDAVMRPIWVLRILPLICAATIVGSQMMKSSGAQGFCLGASCGLLITLLAIGFATTEVIPRATLPRDELQQLHLTR